MYAIDKRGDKLLNIVKNRFSSPQLFFLFPPPFFFSFFFCFHLFFFFLFHLSTYMYLRSPNLRREHGDDDDDEQLRVIAFFAQLRHGSLLGNDPKMVVYYSASHVHHPKGCYSRHMHTRSHPAKTKYESNKPNIT